MSYFDEDIPAIALKSLFQKYDADDDGKLNKSELCELCENDFGLSLVQGEAYHWLIYKDGYRDISFDEFLNWMRSNERLKTVTNGTRYYYLIKAIELFQQYDTNGDRKLCLEEYRKYHLAHGGTEKALQSSLVYLDKDGNGVISFYELLKYLNWIDLEEL